MCVWGGGGDFIENGGGGGDSMIALKTCGEGLISLQIWYMWGGDDYLANLRGLGMVSLNYGGGGGGMISLKIWGGGDYVENMGDVKIW